MDTPGPKHQTSLQIPIDLFVNKKYINKGDLGFLDSDGNCVYKINRQCSLESSSSHKRVLFDAAGIPLISMFRKRVSQHSYFPLFVSSLEIITSGLFCGERNGILSANSEPPSFLFFLSKFRCIS